ncbi:MAG: hypothetical protein Q7W02_02360 [Candidatus Rokubacteria bacterium]|nr:hypothetical protein [Candidatus Rokubacteria bacterium]
METLLLALWIVSLLLSLGSRRGASVLVVPVVVVLVPTPEAATPALRGEDWLRRQLEGLGKEKG